MQHRFWAFITRAGFTAIALGVYLIGANNSEQIHAQTQALTQQPKQTTEPVFRVSKVNDQESGAVKPEAMDSESAEQPGSDSPIVDRVADASNLPNSTPKISVKTPAAAASPAPHPLDRAVNFAEVALKGMRENVVDYTAILAKRELVNGVVGAPSYMNLKIRCPRKQANGSTSPFSIYMKFLRPKDQAGREVIWSEGKFENKLVVHEGSGILRLKRFYLDPTGSLAMNGQRYPIYEAGLENLIVKLIEKADRDRAAGPCTVNYREGAEINKRSCSLIELVHEDRKEPYEFYKAQVFIDDELNMPVRFVAYDWPKSPGEKPQLIEEYTYYNVKVNVGLSDIDFSPENPSYKFPRR